MSFNFNLINSTLRKDNLLYLYNEFIDINSSDPEEKKFTVHRHCKVDDVDVKLLLKLEVNVDMNPEKFLCIQTKISMTTESYTLRKYKSYYNDTEYQKIRMEPVYFDLLSDSFRESLDKHVDSVLDGFLVFKICKICRLLYKDSRTEDGFNVCKNCIFDNCFYSLEENCVVCQEKYRPKDYTFSLTCGHLYHSNCILQHFLVKRKRECPICKELDTHQPA